MVLAAAGLLLALLATAATASSDGTVKNVKQSASIAVSPPLLTQVPVDIARITIDVPIDAAEKVRKGDLGLSKNDFLGIFWPAVAEPGTGTATDIHDIPYMIGWKLLSEAILTTAETGENNRTSSRRKDSRLISQQLTFEIPLVFGRGHAYSFALYTHAGTRLAAVSPPIRWTRPNTPSQLRLALTDRPNEMRVMWVQESADRPLIRATRGLPLEMEVKATCYTYTRDDLCAAPANEARYFREPGMICDGVMSGLVPGDTYTYQVGDNATGDFSAWETFKVPPTAGSPAARDSHVSIVMYGDLGVAPPFYTAVEQQPPSMKTVQWMRQYLEAAKPDTNTLVWHIGDISYARGHAFLWEWFGALIGGPVAARNPYMVTIGNHEYDYLAQPWKPSWADYGSDSGGECGVPYGQRFHMPDNGRATLSAHGILAHPGNEKLVRNLWFSVNHGPVHWLAISTEHDFLPGSPQYNFIAADLAGIDHSLTPWVIVGGHRPMYCSTWGGPTDVMLRHMRDSLEPLFIAHGVDLAFWGHVHKYERTTHLNNFTIQDPKSSARKWPVHIVVGMAGNTFQTPWEPAENKAGVPWDHFKKNFAAKSELGASGAGTHTQQPEWSMFRTDNYGWTSIEVNKTHLHFQYFSDQTNERHDELWLTKEG